MQPNNYGKEILPGAYELNSEGMIPVCGDGLSLAEMTALASEGELIREHKKMMDPKMEGMVRHILTAVGAVMVYMGYMDEAGVATFVGGALTMVGFLWSWMSK